MDDDLKAYLDAMEGRMDAMQGSIAAMQGSIAAMQGSIAAMEGRLMAKLNDGHERIINRLASLERDFQNTKGFLVEDAVVSSRRWLDIDERLTKIERGGKT